jgi:hypothetical protein
MEKDNIFDLIENSKNENVDERFHKFYIQTLNALPNKKERSKLAGLAASIVLVAIISTYTMAFADSIPVIKDIKNYFYAPETFAKYSKGINSVLTYKDYSITTHDIVFDNNFLIFSYTISKLNDKPFENGEEEKLGLMLKIDEKYIPKNSGYSGGSFNRIKENDHQVSYINYYIVKPLNLPDKIGISLSFTNKGKIKKSQKLVVDKTDLSSQNVEVKLDKEIKIPEGSIYLDSISFTPFGAIFFSQNQGGWDFKNADPYYYALFDETGRQLWLPSTSKFFDYKKRVTNIIKDLTSAEYKGRKTITIKTYDSRTGKELDGATVTIHVPNIN